MRARRLPCFLLLLALTGCGDTLWAGLIPTGLLGENEDGSQSGGGWTSLRDGVIDRLAPILNPLEEMPEPDGRALRLWLSGRSTPAVLLQELGERRIWRTSGGVVVATEGGRVTATAGMRQMLAATRFEGPDPLASPAALLEAPAEARRLVDLMDRNRQPEGMRFGVRLNCRLRAEATEDAEVLLVRERCHTPGSLGFTNLFWVEAAGGAVLRTEQWVGPRVPMLVVEFLSPAS